MYILVKKKDEYVFGFPYGVKSNIVLIAVNLVEQVLHGKANAVCQDAVCMEQQLLLFGR